MAKSDDTRQQILTAAIDEFSGRGISGARVDRIAKTAGVNISLLFRYFGNKAQLFDAAFEELAVRSIDVVPFDADDLAGYAGRLMDHYRRYPDIVRLSAWYQLERSADEMPRRVVESEKAKLDAIRDAQERGAISKEFSAEDILNLVLHVSIASTGVTPILSTAPRVFETSRDAAQAAVRTLVEPSAD
ncbi:TetR family transcriptional regulator [Herbiconiux sp. CPCC 205716]|uniref:TetR family transcriptional regulator n=1 Tax=Herbiconiux gentiana TaxID=2970912 RepID=A0ABT2GD71_9MICO|nr:TetR family transcriptional regulator [Herbiconiux gentiana]MCS5714175.1 TetR family transcriptional regulator [Herbiconiux gentiana]